MPMDSATIQIICTKLPEVVAIYRFGSHGTPHERPDSDVDLAILHRQSLAAEVRWELIKAISHIIKKDVDIVDLSTASTVLRFQVLNEGSRIYCSDKIKCDEFETLVFSQYLRFNEERKEILENIARRGRIT